MRLRQGVDGLGIACVGVQQGLKGRHDVLLHQGVERGLRGLNFLYRSLGAGAAGLVDRARRGLRERGNGLLGGSCGRQHAWDSSG